jgi:transcriptional regulator with XRE-family HTH domain
MKYSEYRQQLNASSEFRQAKELSQHRFALGDAMIAARILKGWSQTELARRVGTQQANISRIEAGLSNPTLDLVSRICRTLDLELSFTQKTEKDALTKTAQFLYPQASRKDEHAYLTRVSDSEK